MLSSRVNFTVLSSALIVLSIPLCAPSVIAEEKTLTLPEVASLVHGGDPLKPSAESLIGKYIHETGAQTLVRRFWTAPEGSLNPKRELGPKRLVVTVSDETFKVFKKYFSSKHFLFYLNEHAGYAAFEGRASRNQEYNDMWQGENLQVEFKGVPLYHMVTPILLSSTEGARAENFFELAKRTSRIYRDNPARSPWYLKAKDGGGYCSRSLWYAGCATWFGNMPLGDELVDAYYFDSGDGDGTQPLAQPLKDYETKIYDEETAALIRKVWTVPGHKQLSEMLNPMGNRRGEFDNGGWTTYHLLGGGSIERIPVTFFFVKDVRNPLNEDFNFAFGDIR